MLLVLSKLRENVIILKLMRENVISLKINERKCY